MEDSESQQIAVHQAKEVHNLEHRFGEDEDQPLCPFILEVVVAGPCYIIYIGCVIFFIHASMPWKNLPLGQRVLVIVMVLSIPIYLYRLIVYGLFIANIIRGCLEDRRPKLSKIAAEPYCCVAVDGDAVV